MEINKLQKKIHQIAKDKGFYDIPFNVGEKLMLITSELGEALEAHRKDKQANLKKFDEERVGTPFHEQSITVKAFEENIKDSFEDELADAFIRILDLAEALKINLERHVELKMNYNETRERLHGKKY